MSSANFLEKLLNGSEVEWKPLGELGDFVRGSGLQKKDFVRTGFPAIHYGQIHTQYGLSADKTFTYISEGLANRLKKALDSVVTSAFPGISVSNFAFYSGRVP